MAGVHVPGGLVEDILSRVPVKSLLRFKTASKNWYSLLSKDHKFANFNLERSKTDLMFFQAVPCGRPIFQSLNIDTNESLKVNFPADIGCGCALIGSANGLICVAAHYKWFFFIWNPSTGESKKIYLPVSRASYRVFGFGYDSCSDDYKIVAFWGEHFRVFSLKTNSWKILQFDFRMRKTNNALQLNGALLWFLHSNDKIAVFDLAKEVFSYIEKPDEVKGIGHFFKVLLEYQGLLCILCYGLKDIWVMKKYGDAKSWLKLSLPLHRNLGNPLGISKLGELLYQTSDGFVKADVQGWISIDKSQIYYQGQPGFVYTDSLISPKCFDPQPEKMMIKRPSKKRKTTAT